MEWQPIETAPKDGSWVLVWENDTAINDKYHRAEVAHFINNRWETSDKTFVGATHWMPIPVGPTAAPAEPSRASHYS
jgi:hypothetical protein